MAKTNVVNSKEVEASLMELFDACGEVSKTSDANGVTWNAFGNDLWLQTYKKMGSRARPFHRYRFGWSFGRYSWCKSILHHLQS